MDTVSGGIPGNKRTAIPHMRVFEWLVVLQYGPCVNIPRPPHTGPPKTPSDHPDQSQEYLC